METRYEKMVGQVNTLLAEVPGLSEEEAIAYVAQGLGLDIVQQKILSGLLEDVASKGPGFG